MDPECMKPHGRALLDYLNGDPSATLRLCREDGRQMDVQVSLFFRRPPEFLAVDRAALSACRGRVLDLGAGAGCHVLALQELGLRVVAVDFLPEAVEVMRRRGVREAHCAAAGDFRGGPFDTILMLMNGVGIVETIQGFRHFLDEVRRLLKPNGRLVFDSADLRVGAEPADRAYHEANRRAGRLWGEYRFHLEYRGVAGPPFEALFIDREILMVEARRAGWDCEFLFSGDGGYYVAGLAPAQR